jgi:hypothetical protein
MIPCLLTNFRQLIAGEVALILLCDFPAISLKFFWDFPEIFLWAAA